MDNTAFHSVIERVILRHIFQILPDVTVEQQIHIVHRCIVYQPVQFACFVHIPGNLVFDSGTVDGDHAPIGKFNLDTGSVDIERTGNNPINNSEIPPSKFE